MGNSRHFSRALEGVVPAAISLVLAFSGGKAHAQTHTQGQAPGHTQTLAPPPPAPAANDETPGNRVARARSLIDNLEFDQALAILVTLHDDPRVAPALGAEAALLEANALVGRGRNDDAVLACKRAVVLSGYDPDVARNQSPTVQDVCRPAAEQARRDLVASRRIAIRSVEISTGQVAWNSVRIEVDLGGDLSGLTAQAEVTVGNNAPMVVNLPSSGGQVRFANLDANVAAPGVTIRATPIVRDAFGVLVRATAPTVAMVPTVEAAVQFAPGTDEGPLRVDGLPSGMWAAVGSTLPMRPGPHSLEVRTRDGNKSRTHVVLHRGQVAFVTLHTDRVASVRDILKWSSTLGGVLLLGASAVFETLALTQANQISVLSMQREGPTGRPLVLWDDVSSVEQSRQSSVTLSLVTLIAGGALAAIGTTLWLLPDSRNNGSRRERAVSFGVTSRGADLLVSF